jgi:hypothetical protein
VKCGARGSAAIGIKEGSVTTAATETNEQAWLRLQADGWTIYENSGYVWGSNGSFDSNLFYTARRRWTTIRRNRFEELRDAIDAHESGLLTNSALRVEDATYTSKRLTEDDLWSLIGEQHRDRADLSELIQTCLHGADMETRVLALTKIEKHAWKSSGGRQKEFVRYVATLPWEDLGGDGTEREDAGARGHKRRWPRLGGYSKLRGTRETLETKQAGRPINPAANDEDRCRALMQDWAAEIDATLEEVAAPTKPGRPNPEDSERLLTLGDLVSRAHGSEGFTYATIGKVIGRPRQRVQELKRLAN